MEQRKVYFIQETVRNGAGEFIPCIAVEGEMGYYLTDWAWGTDRKIAQQCADEKNEKLGIDRKTAYLIVLSTMPMTAKMRQESRPYNEQVQ